MSSRAAKVLTVIAIAFSAFVTVGALAVCAIFPNKYAREIDSAAAEFGLNKTLVRSVVWAESKFDRKAVSRKGARGLMQLMPETFSHCSAVLKIDGADPFTPTDNLRCGCYYLASLIERFDGNVKYALMAYNAGEANARKFSDGAPIFPETREYINSIDIAYGFYCLVPYG